MNKIDYYNIHMAIEMKEANLCTIRNKKYIEENFPRMLEHIKEIKEYCKKVDDCDCCPLLDTFCLDIARNVSYYVDI